MPSREETYKQAMAILCEVLAKHGNKPEKAWLGVYAALLWYEQVGSNISVPHIIDTDKLRKEEGVWRQRALSFESYLAQELSCPPDEVIQHVDKLMRSPGYASLQRQNPLGIAFIGIIKALLEAFGDRALTYRTEFPATELFPGIRLHGRSEAPKIDIAAFRDGRLVAIISSKWSIRHDRVGDLVAECRAYKAAAMWSWHFRYYVVTNEFDPARLAKLLGDECLDGLVHVHKKAVVEVCELNSRLSSLLDLLELMELTTTWLG